MEDIDWIFELRDKVFQFLQKLKSQTNPGFFHYSLSGDLFDENVKWGLGNTVFALKIYYTVGMLGNLPEDERKATVNLIKSFQNKDGMIYDPLIKRKTFLREKLAAIRNLDFGNFFHQQTIRAETRQAISALRLLGEKPDVVYKGFWREEGEIEEYLGNLNWKNPWSAGSHFSHLLFFIRNSDLENRERLIDFAINWVDNLQNPTDGSWYKGTPNLQQKVNGAMKIVTALKVTGRMSFQYPRKLIDLCLSATNNKDACDNFNVIYVLHYANKVAGNSYRVGEIKRFALKRLQIYRRYYFPEIGGFSFLLSKTNVYYYGAKITKGLNEPDIHGTCMFLWGISIIAQILDVNKELSFNEQVP